MDQRTGPDVGEGALAVLKHVALLGGVEGPTKTSCSEVGDRIDASDQTASRRLRSLAEAGLVERETVSDGQWVRVTDDGRRRLRAEYEQYRTVFEGTPTVELSGTVTVGMGEGRHYVTLPGYERQFVGKLGYEPYPGTMNVELDDDSVRRRSALSSLSEVHIEGWEDDQRTYGPAYCLPATVGNAVGDRYEGAHVVIPERTHHDERQLELIAPDRLRDALDLADGDAVTVEVSGTGEAIGADAGNVDADAGSADTDAGSADAGTGNLDTDADVGTDGGGADTDAGDAGSATAGSDAGRGAGQ